MLSFASPRSRPLRNSDLFAFGKLVQEALSGSWPEERELIRAYFPDLKIAEDRHLLPLGESELLVTLSPGSKGARRLLDMIEQTMEERFLFQGDHFTLLRK